MSIYRARDLLPICLSVLFCADVVWSDPFLTCANKPLAIVAVFELILREIETE